jgi:hypothetical protein
MQRAADLGISGVVFWEDLGCPILVMPQDQIALHGNQVLDMLGA